MRTFLATAGFIAAITIIYSAADAQTVTVTAESCAQFVEHVPEANVAYTPGVDVEGNPVTPADIGAGTKIEPPEALSIPISIDLQRRLGVPPDPAQYQTENFTVGVVTVRDGRAWFNGQPLQDEEQARLSQLCQQRLDPAR